MHAWLTSGKWPKAIWPEAKNFFFSTSVYLDVATDSPLTHDQPRCIHACSMVVLLRFDVTLTVIDAAHTQGVNERSELTPCIVQWVVSCVQWNPSIPDILETTWNVLIKEGVLVSGLSLGFHCYCSGMYCLHWIKYCVMMIFMFVQMWQKWCSTSAPVPMQIGMLDQTLRTLLWLSITTS